MSWSTWSIVMAAAWKLPPMFPDLLGEYARPFFGMSWTTFMWLLNMLNGRKCDSYKRITLSRCHYRALSLVLCLVVAILSVVDIVERIINED